VGVKQTEAQKRYATEIIIADLKNTTIMLREYHRCPFGTFNKIEQKYL
jgi:hypothetical protein